MSVGANSYGTATDVAALTWAWVAESGGVYNSATVPTLAQVEGWIDQISGVVNTALRRWGFTIPLTDATDVLAVKSIVTGAVADMANYANSSGRFFTERALASGVSPFAQIHKEIYEWVESMKDGLESARSTSYAVATSAISLPYRADSYQDSDESQHDGTP